MLHGGSVIVFQRRGVDLDTLSINDLAHLCDISNGQQHGVWSRSYALLELEQICGAERIGLGDNGNQIDASAQLLHNLNVERLQGVPGGADEVKAGVDTEVDLVGAARLLFLQHVRLMLVVEKLDDGLPRVAVVDIVTEARGVDDGKAD
jgi:hypothetical protein